METADLRRSRVSDLTSDFPISDLWTTGALSISPSGPAALAGKGIRARVGTAGSVRLRRCVPSSEQVPEEEHGIGDIRPPAVFGIGGLRAGDGPGAEVEIDEDGHGVGEVDRAVAVPVAPEEDGRVRAMISSRHVDVV